MREILFRGKRVDNGEWVYGYYTKHTSGKIFIRCIGKDCTQSHEVIPSSVGEYTSLTDQDGKKIFEGDILYSSEAIEDYSLIVVRFDGGLFFDYYLRKLGECHDTEAVQNKDWAVDCEIIGNIHDNFEFLEVK